MHPSFPAPPARAGLASAGGTCTPPLHCAHPHGSPCQLCCAACGVTLGGIAFCSCGFCCSCCSGWRACSRACCVFAGPRGRRNRSEARQIGQLIIARQLALIARAAA